MALKKFIAAIISFFIISSPITAKKTYWKKVIQTAFKNSSSVTTIKNNYANAIIHKLQYTYYWFPKLQLNFQTTATRTRGDYFYILNSGTTPYHTWLLSPFSSLTLYQKLPGQGTISLSANYSFNYLPERNLFIQDPELNLTISQSLYQGIFGISYDPETALINEEFSYYKLYFEKQMSSEFLKIIHLIQNTDILYTEENYYLSLVEQYESELKTSEERKKNKLDSNLQVFYAKHQYNEALNKLKEIQYNKQSAIKELSIFYPNYNQNELEQKRYELFEDISALYSKFNKEIIDENLNYNFDANLYAGILNQYLYQFQLQETDYAPLLYFSSSASINNNFNSYYSDLNKSFRVLLDSPAPIDVTLSIGIKKTFEIPKAKKLRKEIYEIQKKSIEKEFEINTIKQKKQLEILFEQIESNSEYLKSLEYELDIEQNFREKRKQLYEKNIITQNEFFQSETLYYLILKNYISTFWNIICDKINVINLCSKDALLINTFLGENYESVY
ncbi:MAG: hypothetical protein K6E97_11440 [Treponema sp.]|nr:hypothetical protein [Treponema sp.]